MFWEASRLDGKPAYNDAPKTLGKDVTLRMFVDSDHAGDKADRRSRSGFMIFLNMSMIQWYFN